MPLTELQHFALSDAYLCADCQRVSNCNIRCAACASENIMGLARILDREPERKKEYA